jgi:hypothetical protein
LEGEIDTIGFRVVELLRNRGLGLCAILLLKFLAQPLQRTSHPVGGNPLSVIQVRGILHLDQ